ncbi:hypothetical protein WQ54_30865 [Bacillus sp. SA1-12]|uniref:hypothetical protein n=1 Tax=Bacillus sp. SA1-12 TaxID=1455638 RepID=UPI000626EDA1|nr:hypothetical protein [Bacillus sp. SA1-12]KKI88597.1 hypothetical protein WQ54_30865 [Bacillus sp. SA1-12]
MPKRINILKRIQIPLPKRSIVKLKTKFKYAKQTIFSKMTLQTRLIILVLSLLLISISIVGFTSYNKSKDSTMEIIEERLYREVNTTSDIVENLAFAYIGDQEKFMERVNEVVVPGQASALIQDGLPAQFFLVTEQSAEPTEINKNASVTLTNHHVSEIRKKDHGVLA